MECELSNVRVEIYNDKLTSLKPIINVMDICAANNIPLLLAVKDIEYDILNTIIYNQVSGKLKVCVIKIPGHGSYKQDNVDDLIIEDGQVKGIKVLEKLKNSGPKANNHATSLTGTIKINVECNIDESYMYNTYYGIYPRLKIEYGEKVNLTSALRVNFYETDLEDADYLFELLLSADNDKTLAFLTSSNGPAGEPMSAPTKPRDNRYNYYWN